MDKQKIFNVGDVVRLNSGGPKMTIESLEGGGRVNCAYFINGEPKYMNLIHTYCLSLCSESEQKPRFIPDVNPTKRQ